MMLLPPRSTRAYTRFPYTTLFRSVRSVSSGWCGRICSWRCLGFGGRHHSGNGGGTGISESCDRILPPAPVHRPAGSTGLAEREVDPLRAQQRMLAVLERQYAVMAQPVQAPPADDGAVRERTAPGLARTRPPPQHTTPPHAEPPT